MSATLLLLVFGLQLGAVPSEQDRADFAAANEMVLAGNDRGAIALFEDLLARGVSNEDVLFNLGHAYAHSGRLVDAAVAYERALRLVPTDADVAENLARVRQRLHPGKQVARIEQPVEVVEQLVSHVPAALARPAYVVGFASFFLAWFARKRSSGRGLRRVLLVWLALGLLSALFMGAVIAGREWVRLDPRLVVLQDSGLEDGPDARFRDLGLARAGSRARLLDEDGAWVKIQSDEGLTGWLESTRVARIDPP